MTPPFSRSTVDRAGEELRSAAREGRQPDDETFAVAEWFRHSHLALTRSLQSSLVDFFHREVELPEREFPVGSRLKTPAAILAKLWRSSTRLSQMQDIAGARIVVPTLQMQDVVVRAITRALYPRFTRLDDQREASDTFGYRAVHIIVDVGRLFGEIQVRTAAQDQWAQLVESLDASLGSDLKHGRGDAEWLEWLLEVSEQLRRADLGLPYDLPPRPEMHR